MIPAANQHLILSFVCLLHLSFLRIISRLPLPPFGYTHFIRYNQVHEQYTRYIKFAADNLLANLVSGRFTIQFWRQFVQFYRNRYLGITVIKWNDKDVLVGNCLWVVAEEVSGSSYENNHLYRYEYPNCGMWRVLRAQLWNFWKFSLCLLVRVFFLLYTCIGYDIVMVLKRWLL